MAEDQKREREENQEAPRTLEDIRKVHNLFTKHIILGILIGNYDPSTKHNESQRREKTGLKYSYDPNTRHLKSRDIQNVYNLVSRYSDVIQKSD